jgi:hypothetical protein
MKQSETNFNCNCFLNYLHALKLQFILLRNLHRFIYLLIQTKSAFSAFYYSLCYFRKIFLCREFSEFDHFREMETYVIRYIIINLNVIIELQYQRKL